MKMLTMLSDSNTTKITQNAPSTEFLKYVQRNVINVRGRREHKNKNRQDLGTIRAYVVKKSIGVFLTNTYLTLLENLPHVQILLKHLIGTKRHETFKSLLRALFTKHNFVGAIQAAMHNKVQGDHFGKTRKMILEGSCSEYYSKALGKLTKEFHSHLSDDVAQCAAATSFENMYVMLNHLKEKGLLHKHLTVIYNHTYGCTCQYRCTDYSSVFLKYAMVYV
jgi:hypothetical protein